MASQHIVTVTSVPKHLQGLFSTIDFIGLSGKGSKPCFKKRYHSDESLASGFWRWWEGEKQSTRGNTEVRRCCVEIVEAYETYKNVADLHTLILEQMLCLRDGITKIIDIYKDDDKQTGTVGDLRASLSMLDFKIPLEYKISKGIIPPPAYVASAPITVPSAPVAEPQNQDILSRAELLSLIEGLQQCMIAHVDEAVAKLTPPADEAKE